MGFVVVWAGADVVVFVVDFVVVVVVVVVVAVVVGWHFEITFSVSMQMNILSKWKISLNILDKHKP